MFTRLVACACVATQLAGCFTLSPVTLESEGKRPIAAGDDIVIVTRAGDRRAVAVTSVTADALCSNSGCIARSEIAAIDRHEVNVPLTVLSVVALGGLAYLLAVAAQAGAAASFMAY